MSHDHKKPSPKKPVAENATGHWTDEQLFSARSVKALLEQDKTSRAFVHKPGQSHSRE